MDSYPNFLLSCYLSYKEVIYVKVQYILFIQLVFLVLNGYSKAQTEYFCLELVSSECLH
jgi:hypothetical protein